METETLGTSQEQQAWDIQQQRKEAIPTEVLLMVAKAYVKQPEELIEYLEGATKETHNPTMLLGTIPHWNKKFAVTNRDIFIILCNFVGNNLEMIQKYYGDSYVKGSFEEFKVTKTISIKEVLPGIWLNQNMGVPKMIIQLIIFANNAGIPLIEVNED
jgi:hypothetical protein